MGLLRSIIHFAQQMKRKNRYFLFISNFLQINSLIFNMGILIPGKDGLNIETRSKDYSSNKQPQYRHADRKSHSKSEEMTRSWKMKRHPQNCRTYANEKLMPS